VYRDANSPRIRNDEKYSMIERIHLPEVHGGPLAGKSLQTLSSVLVPPNIEEAVQHGSTLKRLFYFRKKKVLVNIQRMLSARALNEQMTCAGQDGFYPERLASTRPALHTLTRGCVF